ncbi:hypothetical protein BDN70DRAFT_130805 [Pholiota conissans]|uniref:F-box domain-containing protein n=1 Tax=Pholiota conissans TaxID=109636 RepID=A0A9P5YZ18_9AGAR|nr:hypothetical protein BDN70DRAFT_130805 [Pholiota conissans]
MSVTANTVTTLETASEFVEVDSGDAVNVLDDVGNVVSEEERDHGVGSDHRNHSNRRKLVVAVTSRLKHTSTETTTERSVAKTLSLMPLDILFEVFSLLTLNDLLHVSLASKKIYETLSVNWAKVIWNRALESQELPKCPSDLTGFRWACLLLENECENCGSEQCRYVDFFLRRRVCLQCKMSNLLVKSEVEECFPDYDELILRLVTCTPIFKSDYYDKDKPKQYYWKPDIERTIDAYGHKKRLAELGDGTVLHEFLEQKLIRALDIHSDAARFETLVRNDNIRRNLLFDWYRKYCEGSVPPPLWERYPHISELITKDPFKAFMNPTYDFLPPSGNEVVSLLSQIPAVVSDLWNELEAELIWKLAKHENADHALPLAPLDLATSVFRCYGSCRASMDSYVIGFDECMSHNCGTYVLRESAQVHVYDSMKDSPRRYVIHPGGIAVASSLVICAGLDPETTLASDMDEKDLRFACTSCPTNTYFGYSWRTAVSHWLKEHEEHIATGALGHTWRLLSPAETDVLKQNEAKDSKWGEPEWQCSHCNFAVRGGNTSGGTGMPRGNVIKHVWRDHGITFPTIPDDLFFFERMVTPFRNLDKLVYIEV